MLSSSKFPYSPTQNPCHFSVIFFHRYCVDLISVIFMSILEYRKNDENNQTSKFLNFQNFIELTKLKKKIKVKKYDKLMARSLRSLAGFCVGEYGNFELEIILLQLLSSIKKFPHFHTAVLQYSKYPPYPKKSAILSVFAVFAIFPCTWEISSI